MSCRSKCLVMWLVPAILSAWLPAHAASDKKAAREKQLTKRAEEFYHLMVTAEWMKVMPYVTEDTRPIWVAQSKNPIDAYQVKSVEIAADGKSAEVNVDVTFRYAATATAPFTEGQKSEWVYQHGQWFIKLRPRKSMIEYFNQISPNPGSLPPQPISFEPNPIRVPVPAEGAEAVLQVSFENITGGNVELKNLTTNCPCAKVEVDKTELLPSEKGKLTLRYRPDSSSPPLLVIEATVAPMMYDLKQPVLIGGGPEPSGATPPALPLGGSHP